MLTYYRVAVMPKAWTGGSHPRPLLYVGHKERFFITHLFRDQVRTWAYGWGDFPDMDTMRIFWRRARFDAHATCRDEWENDQ
jgi:hypothetical protein